MRSEREMLDLILDTASADERIRAVILNGSRANPNARRDFFQDFDVRYIVREVDSFTRDLGWIRRFGELMILQTPDVMGEVLPAPEAPFTYLMQFADGNRIDLHLFPIARFTELEQDSLSVLLLDKDGLFEPFAPADERDYLPKPPSPSQFAACCNEFWWVCPYVAKGLWRGEFAYARHMLDVVVREPLLQMLEWYVGAKFGGSRNPGKFGKYLQDCLEPELWDLLLKTYADGDYAPSWAALFAAGDLFRQTAQHVAQAYGLEYPQQDDERVSAHLRRVQTLPPDAPGMY
ncbi:MAG: aminoglycoside 6-adenylyltransferase [Anaerolineales bacterium]|jgi:aminoglycoside 6-adenylyltransferase|nr:aminoglycoside 6-adenylyltransferase [Anaerolineales bacterium]